MVLAGGSALEQEAEFIFSILTSLRMAANEGDEATVSLVDVLEEDEELENEASAVLAGSDPEKCSYPEVSSLCESKLRISLE